MTRHAPPGHAARGERKEVYSAAMEQAEQFLTASDNIGYEIKPILLYYGFNQMLRAVAAVCYQPKDNWKFGHHGLSCRNLDQIKYLHDVQVEEEGKGAFQVLAELFGSPALESKVLLGDLWVSLPEGSRAPLRNSDDRWTAVELTESWEDSAPLKEFPGTYSTWTGRVEELPVFTTGMRADEVQPLLHATYPLLRAAGVQVAAEGDRRIVGNPLVSGPSRPSIGLVRALEQPETSRLLRLQLDTGTAMGYQPLNRSRRWIIPCLPGNSKPLHSFSTWWAILYALSVLARYGPAKWINMLDINNSPDAASIEYVLDKAHQRGINLVRSQLVSEGSLIEHALQHRK